MIGAAGTDIIIEILLPLQIRMRHIEAYTVEAPATSIVVKVLLRLQILNIEANKTIGIPIITVTVIAAVALIVPINLLSRIKDLDL